MATASRANRFAHWCTWLLLATATIWSTAPGAAPLRQAEQEALVLGAINAACRKRSAGDLGDFVARHSNGAEDTRNNLMSGWRRRFETPGGRLTVERIAPRGNLYRLTIQYEAMVAGALRPVLLVVTRQQCTIVDARRLRYRADGLLTALDYLDAQFKRTRAPLPLNPPVPHGPAVGGVPVALLDTGVNYTLPEFSARLARDADGKLIGYDFWDMDARPFDSHPFRTPFSIHRHGTRIASRLLRDAPVATLAPYRYPRPNMQRLGELVEHVASRGIRIVNISLVSNREREWLPFRKAAAAHPDILFVVAAGNKHRDLGTTFFYPASFGLPNMLVVTSADQRAALGSGVNWGPGRVDVMVSAEGVDATDFDGNEGTYSGSSYAAARVSALAACLLSAHPNWRAAELKASIITRAAERPAPAYVRHGFIDDAGVRRGTPCAAAASAGVSSQPARGAIAIPRFQGPRGLAFAPAIRRPRG